MIKDRVYSCPNCGEEIMITCEDYACDMDSATWYYECDKCHTKWQEYFELVYAGYQCDRRYYDEKGVCTHDYNTND